MSCVIFLCIFAFKSPNIAISLPLHLTVNKSFFGIKSKFKTIYVPYCIAVYHRSWNDFLLCLAQEKKILIMYIIRKFYLNTYFKNMLLVPKFIFSWNIYDKKWHLLMSLQKYSIHILQLIPMLDGKILFGLYQTGIFFNPLFMKYFGL